MAQISYPAIWRHIPAEQWAKIMMTPEEYTEMGWNLRLSAVFAAE